MSVPRSSTNVYASATSRSIWKRGTNENMPERSDKYPWGALGLIRQYFPKGTRLEEITDEQIEAVQEKLNRRPKKTLDFKIPHQFFFGKIVEGLAA